MSAFVRPIIHSNGTSREALYEQFSNAKAALLEADKAMIAASPNGRDYYTAGPDLLRQAEGEHRARLELIRSLICDYEILQDGLV